MTKSDFSYEDLMPGDILCWETGNSNLERLVAYLSGDEYSHTAFVSSSTDTLPLVYETIATGCVEGSFVEDKSRMNRKTTVTRFEGINIAPILAAAKADVEEEVPYGFHSLGNLAALLLLNKPDLILNGGVTVIDGVRDFLGALVKIGGGNEKSTFCSEFVYKCFEAGGVTLEIDNPVIPRTRTSENPSILDLVMEEVSKMGDLSEEDFKKKLTPISSGGKSSNDDAKTSLNGAAGNLMKRLEEDKKAPGERSVTAKKSLDQELFVAVAFYAAGWDDGDTFLEWKDKVTAALADIQKKALVTPGELTRIANENAQIVGEFVIPGEE